MLKITVGEIVKATHGELLSGESEQEINSVSIDSREISKNALFVAIKGENSDGHDYIQKAAENGAVCVISEKSIIADAAVIKVDNSVAALGKIAKYYKSKFSLKTIGVTGSVGKTTTKDMLWSVMNT